MTQCIFRLAGVLIMAVCFSPMNAQTFIGQAGITVPTISDGQTIRTISSTASVNAIGILDSGCSYIENVTIDFTHTNVGDIAIFLVAPDGEILELSSGNGGIGDNYQITEFTDKALQCITEGTPPYNGAFRPEGRQTNTTHPCSNTNSPGTFSFANTFNGVIADGDWSLVINDCSSTGVGVLNAWSITFAKAIIADAGPAVTLCAGHSTILTASGGHQNDHYQWSTGQTGPKITVKPRVDAEYTVTVTVDGCSSVDQVMVSVIPSPDADAGADKKICLGDTVQLTASGGGQYQWSIGVNTPTISVSPDMTTNYIVIVKGDNGCVSQDDITVMVYPVPSANAGADQTICEGETVSLSGSGGETYLWNTGESTQTINVQPLVTTSYQLVASNFYGCSTIDTATIFVMNFDELQDAGVDVVVTPPLCHDECNGVIEIKNSRNDLLYAFADGIFSSNNIFNSACSGDVSYAIMNAAGCVFDATVTVPEPPLFQVDLGPDQSISFGDSVLIKTEVSSAALQFNWFDASTCLICPEITVAPSSSTTYLVEVSDINGCTATDEVEIHVSHSLQVVKNVYIPTVFTPNHDGINDVFSVNASGDLATIKSFQVFDRWGNTVCELKNILPGDEGWDGTCHGSPVKTGVYLYLIRAVFSDGEEEVLTGDITVMR